MPQKKQLVGRRRDANNFFALSNLLPDRAAVTGKYLHNLEWTRVLYSTPAFANCMREHLWPRAPPHLRRIYNGLAHDRLLWKVAQPDF